MKKLFLLFATLTICGCDSSEERWQQGYEDGLRGQVTSPDWDNADYANGYKKGTQRREEGMKLPRIKE